MPVVSNITVWQFLPLRISNYARVVAGTTIQQHLCIPWSTILVGSQWNYIKQERIVIIEVIPSTLAITMDQPLEEDTIFTSLTTLHRTLDLTHTLETPTAHHLATVMDPPSPSHSWRVLVTASNLTRWKSSMKPLEEIEESGVSAIHTLHDKN